MTTITLDGQLTATAARIDKERWNGFVMPYFTRETVDQIMSDLAALYDADDDDAPSHKWEGDVLHLTEGEDTGMIPPTNDGLYPLGAGAWVWSLV